MHILMLMSAKRVENINKDKTTLDLCADKLKMFRSNVNSKILIFF